MDRKRRLNSKGIGTALVVAALLVGLAFGRTVYVVEAPPAGTRPVYRYWSAKLGTHFYTIDAKEKAKIDSQYSHVWTYEGIAFYAWPDPNGLTTDTP